jgi:UV DNA damage endonuclease
MGISFGWRSLINYSSQSIGERKGKHTKTLDKNHFISFYKELIKFSKNKSMLADIMLEIKDKENSALLVLELIKDNNNNRYQEV